MLSAQTQMWITFNGNLFVRSSDVTALPTIHIWLGRVFVAVTEETRERGQWKHNALFAVRFKNAIFNILINQLAVADKDIE